MTAKQSYNFILICIFMLFFAVSSNTPMHSDDFNYAMKGMSLEQHWMHYIGWSGRVISDYISTFVLSFQSLYIKAAITSLAATSLIHFISSVSRRHRDRTIKDCVILITVFFLYWLCHPALGEATFWIVGAVLPQYKFFQYTHRVRQSRLTGLRRGKEWKPVEKDSL